MTPTGARDAACDEALTQLGVTIGVPRTIDLVRAVDRAPASSLSFVAANLVDVVDVVDGGPGLPFASVVVTRRAVLPLLQAASAAAAEPIKKVRRVRSRDEMGRSIA